ncbi:MAG: pentapeptide repeat-containing protein [Hydrococcus sp. CSU_1_8]|nr:pentapeptide repeat-containing protein [Hydrococcus sp. CSU_1_8]
MKASEVLKKYADGERNFCHANLRGQSFKRKDLSGADFSHAKIQSADFSNANLKKCKIY